VPATFVVLLKNKENKKITNVGGNNDTSLEPSRADGGVVAELVEENGALQRDIRAANAQRLTRRAIELEDVVARDRQPTHVVERDGPARFTEFH